MSSTPKIIRERISHLKNIAGPATLAVLVTLVVLLIGSIIYLSVSGGPWESSLRKKLARGSELSWQQYRQLGVGIGLVAVCFLLAITVATAKWWILPCRAALSDQPRHRFPKRAALLYLLGLIVAAGMALSSRIPRLDQSFWNDEEMAFRKYVYGEATVGSDGTLQHQPIGWGQAIFDNEKANNHLWSTIESRVGMALFNHPEAGSPTGIPAFQERAPRLIPLATSALTVIALGWLGWLLGFPRAGLAAAILLALSPWHIRYSVEIRGYSTMLLGIILALGSLIRALETGLWRWWIGYGTAQTIYLLCFAGSAYVAIGINVLAVICIWSLKRNPLANSLRLIVANTLSAVPVAILLTPSLIQISTYVKEHQKDYAAPNFAWFQDLWSHMITAMPWTTNVSLVSNGTSVEQMAAKSYLIMPAMTVVLPALLTVGLIMMFTRNWRSRLVAGSLLLAAALTWAQAIASHAQFLSWYLLYLLPLACLALPYLATLAPRRRNVLPFAIVGIFFIVTKQARDLIVHAPRQPMREAAQWARAERTVPTGNDPATVTAVFGTSDRQIKSYDPRAIMLVDSKDKTPDAPVNKLKALMETARSTKTPLVVYFADRIRAKEENPELLEMLADPTDWNRLAKVPGLEQMYSYEVYIFANRR